MDPLAEFSALLLAPTGSGQTLAAFLASLDRLKTQPPTGSVRVLDVSPLKALGVDVERDLRYLYAQSREECFGPGAALVQVIGEPGKTAEQRMHRK